MLIDYNYIIKNVKIDISAVISRVRSDDSLL